MAGLYRHFQLTAKVGLLAVEFGYDLQLWGSLDSPLPLTRT